MCSQCQLSTLQEEEKWRNEVDNFDDGVVLQNIEVLGTSGNKNHCPAAEIISSNIAGYNLVQDKIIYFWDVQRREQAIKAEKERKKQLVKEAALASRASSILKTY